MLPRQLHDLTSPCNMQGKPSLPMIVGDAGWPSLAINGEGAEPPLPISSSLLASLLHCLQCHQWRHERSFLPPRKERLLTRVPAPRLPSAAVVVRASMPQPPPWYAVGIVPSVVVQPMRGGTRWWHGLPARASIRLRCLWSSLSGRRARPAAGSNFGA